MTTETLTPAERVREYEAQTTGSENLHRHWTRRMLYTDGMAYVAEVCGAHWLIDLVASHQPAIVRRHGALGEFQVWRLERVKGSEWVIRAWSDTPGEGTKLAVQRIPYSDFPEALSPFEFWVENGVAMLKAER